VLKRANSFIRKIEILQFVLIASKVKKRGRNFFLAINANFFDTNLEIKRHYEGGKSKMEMISHPSRKIFRTHLQKLLDEKLLVKLPIKDDKSSWYSITPLGICQLVKSEIFQNELRREYETICIISILLTFATQNVKEYTSLIFEKEKFFSRKTNFLDDLINTDMPRSGSMADSLSNINFENNKFSFYIVNGYFEENILVLARGSFNHKRYDEHQDSIQKNLIQIIELNNKIGYMRNYPLLIDEEQFHHYFANLLLCSLVYRYAIVAFDFDRIAHSSSNSKGKNIKKITIKEYSEYWEHLPEYFQRIIALFSKHATKMVSEQANLMTDFSLTLR